MPTLNIDQLAALAKKHADADVEKIKMSKKEIEKIKKDEEAAKRISEHQRRITWQLRVLVYTSTLVTSFLWTSTSASVLFYVCSLFLKTHTHSGGLRVGESVENRTSTFPVTIIRIFLPSTDSVRRPLDETE